jgi:hypothetical protein
MTPKKPAKASSAEEAFRARRGRGRPSRAEATAKALAALGIDPASIDPRAVLAAIAADSSAPASARVAACKALLTHQPAGEPDKPGVGDPPDELTQRALQILGRVN